METLGLNELVRMNKRQVGGESSIDNRLIVVLILWVDSVVHCLNCLFFPVSVLLYSAVVPSPQLWYDCLVGAYDLERTYGGHRQRKSYSRGS